MKRTLEILSYERREGVDHPVPLCRCSMHGDIDSATMQITAHADLVPRSTVRVCLYCVLELLGQTNVASISDEPSPPDIFD